MEMTDKMLPLYPLLQLQLVTVTDEEGLAEFAGHTEHAALPMSDFQLPPEHAVHEPEFTPVMAPV